MRALIAAASLTLIADGAWADASPPGPSNGEYLTRAADCVTCHTAPGGKPYAGGRAFKLPMGVIYSTNITPDTETGIGNYTDDEWIAAMQQGIGRHGKYLYPVMPYNSYTLMSRDDLLAIKRYLFTLPAVHQESLPDNLKFPYSQRWTLWPWNKLNNPNHRFEPDPNKSAEWNRGAYLVEAVAHCGQCHTPRNWMLGLSNRAFAGGEQQGWLAYNISSDKVHGIGAWSDAELAQYLSSGMAPHHGPASGPMAEAVSNSLRFLKPEDIAAMVTYLRTVPAQPDGPEAAPGQPAAASPSGLGAKVFAEACAGCHLPNGEGRQSPWAALAGDHSTADPMGHNALDILAHGSEMETATGSVFMHSFVGAYTDAEIAAVANYVTETFGGKPGQVTPEDVQKARTE